MNKPKRRALIDVPIDDLKWPTYDADEMDRWLAEEVLPVLRDNRAVFQRAIATMPVDSTGALALIINQHQKRIAEIDHLIAQLDRGLEDEQAGVKR